jgi:hypothetical protein
MIVISDVGTARGPAYMALATQPYHRPYYAHCVARKAMLIAPEASGCHPVWLSTHMDPPALPYITTAAIGPMKVFYSPGNTWHELCPQKCALPLAYITTSIMLPRVGLHATHLGVWLTHTQAWLPVQVVLSCKCLNVQHCSCSGLPSSSMTSSSRAVQPCCCM